MLEFDDLTFGEFSPNQEISLFGTNNDAFLVPSAARNPFLYEADKSAAGDFNIVVNGDPEQQQIVNNVYDFLSPPHQDFSNDKLFDSFAADSNATTGSSLFDGQAGLNDDLAWLCDSLDLESMGPDIFGSQEEPEPGSPSSVATNPTLAELVPIATPKSSMDIFDEIVRESEAFSPENSSRMEETEEEGDTSMDGFYSPVGTPEGSHQGYTPQYLFQANGENFMIAIPANMQIPVTEGTIIQIIPSSTFATTTKTTTKIVPAVGSKPDPEVTSGPSRGKIKYWNAKERKRAQNREAAQRYRQKKKTEKDSRMTEMERLEHRNRQLKLKVSDLDREVGYFKSLISEIQAAAAAAN